MEPAHDYQAVFDRLKQMLEEYAPLLTVKVNGPTEYSLDASYSEKYARDLFFGAVKIQKRYVSYYLFPVYMFPDLLEGISPGLKKHMQGKSCFNFNAIDEILFTELSSLTRSCFERFQQEEFV